jgi:hypothetical protein
MKANAGVTRRKLQVLLKFLWVNFQSLKQVHGVVNTPISTEQNKWPKLFSAKVNSIGCYLLPIIPTKYLKSSNLGMVSFMGLLSSRKPLANHLGLL